MTCLTQLPAEPTTIDEPLAYCAEKNPDGKAVTYGQRTWTWAQPGSWRPGPRTAGSAPATSGASTPRDPTGKILQKDLRAKEWAGHERAIVRGRWRRGPRRPHRRCGTVVTRRTRRPPRTTAVSPDESEVLMNATQSRPRHLRSLRRPAAVGVAAALTVLAACSQTEPGTGAATDGGGGESTLDRITEEGTVRVGFANERPYAFREGGDLVGEAPAVHGHIFEQLGVETLEPNLFEFGSLIQALNSERVDVVTAGMFITPERCEQAAFSNPEYVATTALLVPEGNPENLSDYASVVDSGVTLAVMNGAVESQQATASGIPDGQLQIVADQQAGLDAVKSGRADAFALTSISLRALAESDNDVEVAEAFIPVIDGEEQIGAGAAVFRQGDDELREAFNEELRKILEDGTWLELVEPYGFTEAEKPDPELTAEQLCEG
jgi:polar amino acid transport system substrate-binding protein